MKLNENFQSLGESYLFVTIAKKVAAYQRERPEAKIIKMGIGDVTLPLAPAVIEALHKAAEEQARKETFHGYSPDSDGALRVERKLAGTYQPPQKAEAPQAPAVQEIRYDGETTAAVSAG